MKIDIDGSGTIEFDEYVRVMATYCMYSQDEILRFFYFICIIEFLIIIISINIMNVLLKNIQFS
jgi:hypothetical protein